MHTMNRQNAENWTSRNSRTFMFKIDIDKYIYKYLDNFHYIDLT